MCQPISNDYRPYPADHDHRAGAGAIKPARLGGVATRSSSSEASTSLRAIAKPRNGQVVRPGAVSESGGITVPPVKRMTAAARLAAILERRRALEAGVDAGPTTQASVPNCRTNIGVIAKWETQAEDVFASAGNKAQCRTACAEAEILCKGCPFVQSCAEKAKSGQYTGIAGGRIFVNGRNRLTPSAPTKIVA